jgi:hypothetical protein
VGFVHVEGELVLIAREKWLFTRQVIEKFTLVLRKQIIAKQVIVWHISPPR